jgi:hypothetical protein
MTFAKLLSFALLFVCSRTINAATVEMGSIVMQLRSTVDGNDSEVIAQMLDTTTTYLNNYFGSYYQNTVPQDYFSNAALSVNSFGIHGGQGSYITTLEFEGLVFFNSEPTPSDTFTLNLLSNAFQGLNQKIFLNEVVKGDSQFLKKLTYMVIEINDLAVTENNLVEGAEDATTPKDEAEKEKEEENWYDAEWVDYAIFAVSGAGGTLVMLCLFFLCRFCCCNNQQESEGGKFPVKAMNEEVGTMNRQTRVLRQQTNEATLQIAKTYSSGHSRSPSPERSVVSQTSSTYTYNPSGMSMSKDGLSLGSISNIHTEAASFDVEAWQNKNPNFAPFGHDISAIDDQNQTRDLSLIDEGSEDSYQERAAKQQMLHHYRHPANALEVRQSRSRPVSKRGHSQPNNSHDLDYYNDDNNSYNTSESSGDVINDLRNLSAQIDRHRRAKGEY